MEPGQRHAASLFAAVLTWQQRRRPGSLASTLASVLERFSLLEAQRPSEHSSLVSASPGAAVRALTVLYRGNRPRHFQARWVWRPGEPAAGTG